MSVDNSPGTQEPAPDSWRWTILTGLAAAGWLALSLIVSNRWPALSVLSIGLGAAAVGWLAHRNRALDQERDRLRHSAERLRQAESDLKASEKRFRALVENSLDMVALIDDQAVFRYVSPALTPMLGYAIDEFVGRNAFDFLHPEEVPLSRQRFAELVQRPGGSLSHRFRYRHKDGSYRWIEALGTNLLAEPSIQSLVADFRDVTERRQAEEALRESEAFLLISQRAGQSGSWEWHLATNQVRWSDEMGRIHGIAPGTFGGTLEAAVAFIHPADLPYVREGIQLLLEKHEFRPAEYRIVKPDGEERMVWGRGELLLDSSGKPYKVIGTVSDVTERKQAELALRESEERYRSYYDLGLIGMAITSPDKGWVQMNDRLCQDLGYTREELAAKTWAELTYPDDLAPDVAQFNRVLAGEIDGYGMEKRFIRKDGRVMDADLSVKCLRGADRSVRYFVVLMQDVTDRKLTEAASRRLQEQLLERQRHEKELVEAELAKVRGELVRQTRLAALGQVAGSIAHELRNPLGAIRNAVYFLKRRVPPTDDPKWAEHLGIIEHETIVTDQIISNLLEMTRPRVPARQSVDLLALARDAFARARPPEGVRWSLAGAPDPFPVEADPVLLRQVLDNLLKNALDAVGGSGEVRVTVEAEAGHAVLTVRDSGPGVAAEHRASLFEPLFTTKAKGTGLGLFLSRQIVERHGGTLELVDAAGPGAAFQVRLPTAGPRG